MEAQQTAESKQSSVYHSYERISAEMGNRKLVCIEYPGVVQNVDKALQTLEGQKVINKNLAGEKKRLEVRFRPEDVYCKPASGTSHRTAGFLMRVRRRRRKEYEPQSLSCTSSGSQDTSDDGYEYMVDILGTVNTAIKFEGICEFQYLPMVRREDDSYGSILEKLMIRKFTQQDEYMSRQAPLFLSPVMFTRFDTPQEYGYLQERHATSSIASYPLEPTESVAVGRKKRQRFTTMVKFKDPSPMQASREAVLYAQKFKNTGLIKPLQELFEERPIWPKSALMYRLRHNVNSHRYLKNVLPSVAYVFLTGPWRAFWIKIGYDPRQDPTAKKFQGIDFRRRQKGVGETLKIQSKRSTLKKTDPLRKVDRGAEISLSLLREDPAGPADSKEPKLRDFEFHADVLPPHRQVCYMVCDIFDSEIQALVSKNDGKETVCDERNGWCINNFTDMCRTIMATHVNKLCPDNAMSSKMAKQFQTRKNKLRSSLRGADEEEETASSSMDTGAQEEDSMQ